MISLDSIKGGESKIMEKNLRFNSTLTEVKKVNPLFSRGKAYILYEGINRNNSHLGRESIEKAIPSIYNIPIVGEYIEESDNFGGHGGKIEITDTDIKFKVTTKPYGVIPESANIYWEDVTEKDGTVRSYLVADGIYLWSGRYEELNTLLEEEKYGQSMEIEVLNADFTTVDGQETFKIDEFIFSALCILGIDKGGNPDDHVEPAFESASISVYEFDKDSFKREFNQMLAELKFSLQEEGGKNVEDVKQEVEEQVTETAETEVVETEEKVEDVTEETVVTETDETFEQTETDESTDQVEETVEETQEETESETTEEIDTIEEVETEETFSKEFVEGLQSQIDSLSTELADLKSYKRQREEQDLSAKFEDKLSKEELELAFSENTDKSLEEIEVYLFALVGKKNFSINKANNKESNRISLDFNKFESQSNKPYNGFFDKYLK